MKINKILLVSHVYSTNSGYVYGPVDVIEDYLKNKKRKYKLVKYPLTSKIPLVLKSIYEISNSIFVSLQFKPDLFIGIDPLNALVGIILRKLHLIKKTIFYCVDYTPTRFNSKFVNSIYLWCDEVCAKYSDEVWNVSLRIVNLRHKQGIPEEKIKYVPNSPRFSDCVRLNTNKIVKNQIVMVTGLTHSPVFDLVLNSIKVVIKKIPKLKLLVIGTGPYHDKLVNKTQKMGLSNNVEFLGQLENKNLLKKVSESNLALAIYSYSKEYSWVYYGDSKKAREYLACGTPVIITDVVGTSVDVEKYKSGIVIRFNKNDLINAIEKLMLNNDFWRKSRKNAIKLGRDFDIDAILNNIFGINSDNISL